MRILFFANLIPYPLDGGGKIFTHSVLKALSETGHIVDMICFYENEDVENAKNELQPYCNSITALPIKVTTRENLKLMMFKAAFSLFSDKPLGVIKYLKKDMIDVIENKIRQTKYDCAFFNILAMYVYADTIKKYDESIKTVLYEQNCETLIYKRYIKETNNLLKKTFLTIETIKLNKFEKSSIKAVDKLILLSNEDRVALNIKEDEANIIPIGICPPEYKKMYRGKEDNMIRMLFIGTMTWAPNNEGMIWFLENVMPNCSDANKYELYIIGKNPSDKVQELCKKYQNIYLLGYVEKLEEYYEKCDVLVVPLFIGSGQRVKIIEAFSRSFPVISTSIGLEGLKYIDGETVLVANDANTFKYQIDKSGDYQYLNYIGGNGKKVFDKEYSTHVIKEKISKVLMQ